MPERRLHHRLRVRAMLPDLGAILLIAAVAMAACATVGLFYAEWWAALWFAVSATISAGAGVGLRRTHRDGAELERSSALATAGGGWAVVALVGAVPFLLAAHLTPESVTAGYVPAGAAYETSSLLYFRNPLHCLFESMSGWTTTGLTMAVHEPSLPHAFLFYRSLMQWVGGAGILVLAVTVLHHGHTSESALLYRAEGRQDRLRPSIVSTARYVWRIYAAITVVMAVYLFVATVSVLDDYPLTEAAFDAINHAMTGQSTGGFSTLDDSIAGYGSSLLEVVYLVPMAMGAIALPVHYAAIRRRTAAPYLEDSQNRVMFGLFVAGGLLTSLLLAGASAVIDPTREGVFQFISALSTTGWQTSVIGGWPDGAIQLAAGAMVIGGAAGATVGGIKILRATIIAKGAWWQVRSALLPRSAVGRFRIGGETVSEEDFERQLGRAATMLALWIAGLGASVLVMTVALGGEYSFIEMLFESASAQGTVGLSVGITGPSMPPAVEIAFILQMWLGRLEIIPVVVFLVALIPHRRAVVSRM